jgi:hypothetical protein
MSLYVFDCNHRNPSAIASAIKVLIVASACPVNNDQYSNKMSEGRTTIPVGGGVPKTLKMKWNKNGEITH